MAAAEPTKKVEEVCQESMETIFVKDNDQSQNVGQLIFEFFDEVGGIFSSAGSSSSWDSTTTTIDLDGVESVDDGEGEGEGEEEEEENVSKKAEATKAFWDSQEELLVATLRRTTSLESRIRKATKEALMELNSVCVNYSCHCLKRVVDGCRECIRKEVCDRLQKDGFSCRICKSKWSSSREIPAGEHVYLEVVQNSSTCTKSSEVKVIIELNFKSEFIMARGCEEYDRLINRLPEVFVGKAERLKTLIKILCYASKKCMKEKKMHIAPWRKHKYMQAKWLSKTAEKQSPILVLPSIIHLEKSSSIRPKASMLTFDLLETLPNLHQATMIKVV